MDLDVEYVASLAQIADTAAKKAVADLFAGMPPLGPPPIAPGGDGEDNGSMESRVARLEGAVEHIERDIAEIKGDLRAFAGETRAEFGKVRGEMETNFRVLFGALIAVALGLAALMARGFGWL